MLEQAKEPLYLEDIAFMEFATPTGDSAHGKKLTRKTEGKIMEDVFSKLKKNLEMFIL